MSRRNPSAPYSLRSLQSLLGVSRSVLTGLIEAGFVQPSRGPRNELRFGFQDVVLLRTAYQLQSANIPSRKIVRALAKLKSDLPVELPLSGMRITSAGNSVVVKTGPSQWEVDSGQFVLDFEVAPIRGAVTFLDSTPRAEAARAQQANEWVALGEQLEQSDPTGAELAYRKAIALSPQPHWYAYGNLGFLLCQEEGRCEDALAVFDEALRHFPDTALLHFNRAVVLEELDRAADAEAAYVRCLEIDPTYEDARYNLERLSEMMALNGDGRAALRHMNILRRFT